ncbi:MAG: hypothetical protein SangKO_098910 [Sandaracinaceae bacterium]
MTDRHDRLDLPTEDYESLARVIASDQSPVGIDAKKTHVVILHLLLDIQDRLARLEARLDA